MTPAAREPPRRQATNAELQLALRALDGAPERIPAGLWPGSRTDVGQPGLYSWWVDVTGSEDLAAGLGVNLDPGRIYAGQTGATKWPSGTTGKMTLQSRIWGNHLRGTVHGSTFRLTLAACLRERLELEAIAPRRLAAASERRLSAWLVEHLEVAVHPFPERAVLADLERRVLAFLDPPLNLDGMPSTALRSRLRARRARLGTNAPERSAASAGP
jgi:hypothetical protein